MKKIEGKLNIENLNLGIIVSKFNEFITEKLLSGALDAVRRLGGNEENITVVKVPGAFEIPLVAKQMIRQNTFDGIVCLGAVIKGDTPHFDLVVNEATKGIAGLSLETGVPLAFGVLACNTLEQAIERAGSKMGNKGYDAMCTLLESIDVLNQLKKEQ